MSKTMIKTYLAMAITIVLWASAFVGIRIGLLGYEPGPLALLRYLVASVVILIPYCLLSSRTPLTIKDAIKLFSVGVIGIGLYNITLNLGEVQISAGVASFLIGLTPVITIFLARFLLKEYVNPWVWLGVAVSLIGLLLIAISEDNMRSTEIGVAWVLIAALANSVFTLAQRPLLKKFQPLEITVFSMWGGALSLLFYFPEMWHEMFSASLLTTLTAVYMGIFPAVIAYWLWSYALRYIEASSASLAFYVLPIVVILMGMLVFQHHPGWLAMLGGSIAVVGSLYAALVRRRGAKVKAARLCPE